MSSAKADILARVRGALGPAPAAPEIPRAYRAAGALPRDGIVDLFAQRVAEYRATVHRVSEDEVAATVARLVSGRVGVPAGWNLKGPGPFIFDDGLSVAELDSLDAVVTGCALAIADTGTIVLDSGPASGRRALTLVPDHHVCIVRAEDVVPSVPDAIAALDPTRPLTFVSGPSATSDIELDRVEGVHGPRRLDVVLTGKQRLAYRLRIADVFHALAAPARRAILDELTDRDGQTLFELCARLTMKHGLGLTRQAVSQHLDVLEHAGLVRTRKDGRYKFHHLDTAPLDEIVRRWKGPQP